MDVVAAEAQMLSDMSENLVDGQIGTFDDGVPDDNQGLRARAQYSLRLL